MKKVVLVVFLMMGLSVANAEPTTGIFGNAPATAAAWSAFTVGGGVGFVIAAARMNSNSPDLNKTVTVNRKGDGYNGTMTVYEYNRSDKSVYSLVN